MQEKLWIVRWNPCFDIVNVSSDESKDMNIQDEITALNAQAAVKQRTAEMNAYASALEDEVGKLLSNPHFPEEEKKRILAKLNSLDNK